MDIIRVWNPLGEEPSRSSYQCLIKDKAHMADACICISVTMIIESG